MVPKFPLPIKKMFLFFFFTQFFQTDERERGKRPVKRADHQTAILKKIGVGRICSTKDWKIALEFLYQHIREQPTYLQVPLIHEIMDNLKQIHDVNSGHEKYEDSDDEEMDLPNQENYEEGNESGSDESGEGEKQSMDFLQKTPPRHPRRRVLESDDEESP